MNPTDKELIDWAVQNKRVDIIVKHKWGFDLSPGQTEIVRKIAFLEVKKLSISAMTRYGKTQCVALGIALLLDFDIPAKVAFLGPKEEQAGIIRQYLAELIIADKSLLSKAQIYVSGTERIGKEASRKRMTFTTGAEYRVFSGEGDADRLMGFGCVPPDATLITNEGPITAIKLFESNKNIKLYSYNHKKGLCEFRNIKHRIKNPARKLIKIVNTSGSMIVTDNHPVYVVGKGYVEAREVGVNDKLLKCNCFQYNYGNNIMLSMRKHNNKKASKLPLQDKLQKGDVEEVIVTRIERLPATTETYNFEVEDNNNYFVDGILTHNCDILIRDEACLINRTAFAKSSRMLGDNPENAIEIELYNPWNTDNKAYEHTLDPAWEVIQIGWRQAVSEGRTTEKFVEQQKKDLLPLEFTVLYESKFPEQSDDALFSMDWVTAAEQRTFNFKERQDELLKELVEIKAKSRQMGENQYRQALKPIQEELAKFTNIISCDPAEAGLDETVILWGIEYDNNFQVVDIYSEPKSEPMQVVGKVISMAEDNIPQEIKGKINIDRIGIGSGPLSRIREVIKEKNLKHITVTGCHYGEKAMKKDIFHNKKAENYFRLADIMREGMIDIPEHHKIRKQLTSEKWERTSANRKIVKDPEDKSPDWGDALVYFIWKDKTAMAYGFV